jgi:serine protease Do
VVGDVTPGAPGDKGGLKSGDVITAIDGKKVEGPDDLTMDVVSDAPGTKVKLDIIRNGQPTTATVTLGQRPGGIDWAQQNNSGDNNPDNDNSGNTGNASMRGITVENLTPELAQQVGAANLTRGVVVDNVDADSPAADNLTRGMVITAVDRHPVNNVQDFKRLMSQAQGKPTLITFSFQGQTGFTVVQPSNK